MTSQRSLRLRRASVRAASLSLSPCPSPLRAVSEAVLRSVLGAALLVPAVLAVVPGQGHAQSVGESRHYSVAAGPLDKVLTAFAASSGVMLSFEPSQVQGLQSSGLQGEHTVWGGFSLLLQGTGLEAQSRGPGSYVLRKAAAAQSSAADGAGALPGVTVRSRRTAESEGTGSYTSVAPIGTATKLAMTLRETPQSVTVVTRQRMEDQGMTQLTDVFRQTAGLTLIQNGSQGSDSNSVWSRGFTVENYQIDGVPQLSNWLTQTADLTTYDRVEVLRGATGLTNGVGSPAATINLVRKRPFADFQASVTGSVGSWDKRRVEADVSSPLNQSGSVRGRVVAALQANDSWIDREQEEKRLLYGIVEADLMPGTKLTAGFEHQVHNADAAARSGLPLYFNDGTRTNFSRSLNASASWAHSYQRQQQVFASLDHQLNADWAVRATFNHSRRGYDDVLGYAANGNPARNGSNLGVWANKWNSEPVQNALDLYVSGAFTAFGRKHDLVAGYNVSRTTYDAPGYPGWPSNLAKVPDIFNWDGNTPAQPAMPVTSMTHFAEKQSGWYSTVRLKPADGVAVILGARVSDWQQDRYTTGAARTPGRLETGEVTPYAGLVVDVNENWTFYASKADIFKPQTVRDINDEFLDPVTGQAREAGLKGAFFKDRLNVSFAFFEIRQENLGVQITPVVNLPSGSTAYRPVAGVTTRGYEAEVTGELTRGWQVSASYTSAKSRDRLGVRQNTQVPMDQFKLFSTYQLTSVGHGLTLGGGVTYQSDIYGSNRVTPTTGPAYTVLFTQSAYAVVDLMARYAFSEKLSATMNLGNALDKTYYTTASSGYYGAPRNVNLTVKYQF